MGKPSKWKCYTCRVEMEKVLDISVKFRKFNLPKAEGLRCPQCGVQYLESDYVAEQVSPAEEMLSGK